MISHWDDVEAVRRERGHICGDWQALTGDASEWIGVQRIQVAPGKWSTPLHLEGAEEEIFFVLGGDGLSAQRIGERRRRSRSTRATASSIWLSCMRTPSRQAPTGSTFLPSASAAMRRTRFSRVPAFPGSARHGCSRARPMITRGSERQRQARRRWTSPPSGHLGSSTSRTRARDARRGDGRTQCPGPRSCRRVVQDRHPPLRGATRQADQSSALSQRRGGDLRRPRRRGDARALAASPVRR